MTERERFYIDARQCAARSDPECFRDVNELWKRTYPRDGRPYGNLSDIYVQLGMCDKALKNATAALRLELGQAGPYIFVADAYLCLEKPAEARQTLQQAILRHLENPFIYNTLFRAAFYDRDDRSMTQVREWASGQPEESLFKELDSDAAAFDGRMRRSRELRLHAEQLAALRLKERVLAIRARGAFYEAAQEDVQRARDIVKSVAAESPPASLTPLLLATALLSRDDKQVDALLRGQEPITRGAPALLDSVVGVLREVAAGDRSAIARLPPASPRELSPGEFRPAPEYMRGLAYLHVDDGEKAAAEFQRILDHRGLAPISPLYPLAYVQLARAYTLSGDHVKARKAYQDFLALWKDADPDIPILRDAKAEYARLSKSQAVPPTMTR